MCPPPPKQEGAGHPAPRRCRPPPGSNRRAPRLLRQRDEAVLRTREARSAETPAALGRIGGQRRIGPTLVHGSGQGAFDGGGIVLKVSRPVLHRRRDPLTLQLLTEPLMHSRGGSHHESVLAGRAKALRSSFRLVSVRRVSSRVGAAAIKDVVSRTPRRRNWSIRIGPEKSALSSDGRGRSLRPSDPYRERRDAGGTSLLRVRYRGRCDGGDGEGPGEFRSLASVEVGPGDSIYVFDDRLQRLTVFLPDGSLVRVTRLTPDLGFRAGSLGRLRNDRWYAAEASNTIPTGANGLGRDSSRVAILDANLQRLREVVNVPAFLTGSAEMMGQRMSRIVPFSPRALFAHTESCLFTMPSDSNTLPVFRQDGEVAGSITLVASERAITDQLRLRLGCGAHGRSQRSHPGDPGDLEGFPSAREPPVLPGHVCGRSWTRMAPKLRPTHWPRRAVDGTRTREDGGRSG